MCKGLKEVTIEVENREQKLNSKSEIKELSREEREAKNNVYMK